MQLLEAKPEGSDLVSDACDGNSPPVADIHQHLVIPPAQQFAGGPIKMKMLKFPVGALSRA